MRFDWFSLSEQGRDPHGNEDFALGAPDPGAEALSRRIVDAALGGDPEDNVTALVVRVRDVWPSRV